MSQIAKDFLRKLLEKEAKAVAQLAQMALQVDMYSRDLTDTEQRYVDRVVKDATDTLSHIKVIKCLPISFN